MRRGGEVCLGFGRRRFGRGQRRRCFVGLWRGWGPLGLGGRYGTGLVVPEEVSKDRRDIYKLGEWCEPDRVQFAWSSCEEVDMVVS